MKRIDLGIFAMALLLAFLSYTAVESRVGAQLTCLSLANCCGAAGCAGPGTPSGCSIECAGGGSVVCCSNASGRCLCGPKNP